MYACIQENEEESMSWERFSHLYDLMQMGNKAFRANRFEEVINSLILILPFLAVCFSYILVFRSGDHLNCDDTNPLLVLICGLTWFT